jgi:hypothetical protein
MTNANELLLISPRRNAARLFHSRSVNSLASGERNFPGWLAGALSVFTKPNFSVRT